MSNIGDQIRMDVLLKLLQGKDISNISNMTIILGTCEQCRWNKKDGCKLGNRFKLREPSTFCCVDFIKKKEDRGEAN